MTKKLTTNQKKFNAMIRGLASTWNCENDGAYACNTCPFRLTDEVKEIARPFSGNFPCGAITIRDFAVKLFPNNNKIKDELE